MKLRLISDFLCHLDDLLDDKYKVGKCSPALSKVIDTWDVPNDLKRLFKETWINRPLELRHHIFSVSEIVKSTDQGDFRKCGYIRIGSCANGDMIAVDYRKIDCPVVIVSHDKLWGSKLTPRQCSITLYNSLAEYVYRVCEFKYLPYDSYYAKEYRELLDEIGG